jgi:2-dehydropantoate 2-reductase
MKHAVLGAGAIGGLMATALAAIGEDVTLIVRRHKLHSHPERLTLERPAGTIAASVRVAAKLTQPVDVLWIATKAHDLASALEAVEAIPGIVVPLLNGTDHVPVLHTRFGNQHVVPGTIAVEAERLAEGHFAQRSGVRLSVAVEGEPVLREVLARLQEQLGFVCQFFESLPKLLWTKLSFLAPFALVTSASGKNKGEIFSDAEWKAKLQAAFAEAISIARAYGAEIDVAKLQAGFESFPDAMRSSMAKDLAAGRKLELDAIAGPILRGAEKFGIAVPVTRELVAAIEIAWARRAAETKSPD